MGVGFRTGLDILCRIYDMAYVVMVTQRNDKVRKKRTIFYISKSRHAMLGD
jgi:hypothetical protein